MFKKLLFGFTVVSLFSISQAQAAPLDCVSGPVQLSVLIASDGCIVGDKLFNNFSDITNPVGSTPQPNEISVLGITTEGNYGIQFSGAFLARSGQTLDFLLSYVVTVLDPTMLLTDIHLFFNGDTTGTGFAAVTETVRSPGFEVLGQATVTTDGPLSAEIGLSRGVTSARVTKDIILSGGSNGTAFISLIDQVTSQTAAVPEPASLTLLGTGFLGLVRAVRRRRKLATA